MLRAQSEIRTMIELAAFLSVYKISLSKQAMILVYFKLETAILRDLLLKSYL